MAGRWKTLIRAYKKVKDDNKKSGRGRKTFQYEDAIDEVLGNDPAVTPEVTLSSRSGKTNMDMHSSSDEESTTSVKVSETSDNSLTDIPKKRNVGLTLSQVVETVQEMMRAQDRRHNQRMEMFDSLMKMQMNNVSSASSSKSRTGGKRRREPTPSDSD